VHECQAIINPQLIQELLPQHQGAQTPGVCQEAHDQDHKNKQHDVGAAEVVGGDAFPYAGGERELLFPTVSILIY